MKTHLVAHMLAVLALVRFTSGTIAEEPFSYLTNSDLVISKATDTNEYLAYSKHSGAWKRHAFAQGTKAIPVLSGSLCVFALAGDSITELVGVDRQGNWRIAKLATPTKECKPLVSESVAVFNQDGRTYAFSSITGTWDSVPTMSTSLLESDMVLMKTEDSIAVFSAQTGRWAETSLKSEPR
jgi:hypothetical protein